jgi:hypothetical protein
VTIKNSIFWEERIPSIIRVRRIGELGTSLTVPSNQSTQQRKEFAGSCHPYTVLEKNPDYCACPQIQMKTSTLIKEEM